MATNKKYFNKYDFCLLVRRFHLIRRDNVDINESFRNFELVIQLVPNVNLVAFENLDWKFLKINKKLENFMMELVLLSCLPLILCHSQKFQSLSS